MLMQYLALPVSAVLGFLAGLGVGGGSLLILWLTAVVGMEYPDARTVNLLFFLPCAIISTLFRRKEGSVSLKKALPAIMAGCAAAALFAFFGRQINTEGIKKLFGILLIFTGLRELFYRQRKAK